MNTSKVWKCDRCGEKTIPYELIRIEKRLYNIDRYKQFGKDFSIDLCEKCYNELFNNILEEIKEGNKNGRL